MGDVIDSIIAKEGGFSNNPADAGGRTDKGISEKSNPEAWADGVVTADEARAIYEAKYLKGPGFDLITDKKLQAQLVDFGVNSGPAVAIQKLQLILGVPQDGILGPETLQAIKLMHADDICCALVAERVKMIARIVAKNPVQLKFLVGWVDRAVEFLN